MSATSGGNSHADTMQKLERLNQLETVTVEQRLRIEKYRTMYETVKTEHEYLQEEKNRQLSEMSSLKEGMKTLEDKCQEVVTQARHDLDKKISECEELKLQIYTPQKLEVLKVKLQDEVEEPYRKKLESMEVETEKYRNEFNRLRYDYSFLKSEYDHEMTQKKTFADELIAKFNIEKEGLHKEIKSLGDELSEQDNGDKHKLRMLQKDNTQLNLRLKSLVVELEEVQERNQAQNNEIEQTSRVQTRQLQEMSLKYKTLETELETSKQQHDRLQKELSKVIHEQDKASSDLHETEKSNMELRNKLESQEHTHKMEVNNLRLTVMQSQSELERERDSIQMELNSTKGKLKIVELSNEELKKQLEKKEEEIINRVQKAKEEDWSKINSLESTKAQLEAQISSAEQQRIDTQTSFKTQLEKCEQLLKIEKDEKERTEQLLTNEKNVTTQCQKQLRTCEKEKEQLYDLKQKHQKLQITYENLTTSDQQTKNENEKLVRSIDMLRRELETSQEDLSKQREAYSLSANETKSRLLDEQKKLQKKYCDEHKEHKQLKKKYEKLNALSKKKIRRAREELAGSMEEMSALKAKQDHHELEKQSLRKNLDLEKQKLRRKMEKLRQRQFQFSNVLNASNFNIPDNNLTSSPKKHLSPKYDFLPPRSMVSPMTDMFDSVNIVDENHGS